MSNKMKELLQEQTTADQANNSNSSNGSDNKNWQRLQIDGTPFWIIGNEEKGYNIIMGKWKLTNEPLFLDGTDTLNDTAKYWLQDNLFNTILSMIICVTTDIKGQNDTNKKY